MLSQDNKETEWLLTEKYAGVKTEAFYADCKRLALGEPLAYLIGWTPFLNSKIWLDNRPLIPRPETEYWVNEAIGTIRKSTISLGLDQTSPKILDLCAGSGCVGVSILKEIEDSRVDFAEIDSNLIPTITKNIKENKIEQSRTEVLHSNLFSKVEGTYDFILSNPPYIDESLNRADKSVKDFEPYVALFGGEDGMEIINQIITEAHKHLSPGGQIWLEHEPEQIHKIADVADENGFSASIHKDQYQIDRYSILVLQ